MRLRHGTKGVSVAPREARGESQRDGERFRVTGPAGNHGVDPKMCRPPVMRGCTKQNNGDQQRYSGRLRFIPLAPDSRGQPTVSIEKYSFIIQHVKNWVKEYFKRKNITKNYVRAEENRRARSN